MANMPPLAAIRVFEAAARHLNYTRAAEELGLTQAGVSYQIKVLEERVGTVLFVREGRGMALTPAGELLAPRLSRAFSEMEGAFTALRQGDEDVLSVTCSQTFATQFLAPRLGSFQLAHPGIAVRIDFSDRIVDLAAGEADVGIRVTRDIPAGLESRDLMRLGITALASPHCVASFDLAANGDIPDSARISPQYHWWQLWDAAVDGMPREAREHKGAGALQFDSQLLDAQAAMAGNGVALLAPALFQSEIESGRLCRPLERIVWVDMIFRLVYPAVRRHSPKVRAFRDWLRAELAELLADDPDGVLINA